MLLGIFALISAAVAVLVCHCSGAFADFWWLLWLPLSFVGCFLALAALMFGFLLILCSRVDQEKEQEKDDPLYRTVANLCIAAALPVLQIRIRTKGTEKMPKSGRFLLVCNHVSLADPVMLLRIFHDRQLAFISKRKNKNMFVVGPLLHKMLGQLINRENDREALKTILRCIQILKEDKASIAVFPEGGINDDRKFHHLRPGVFKIAQKANVPIVVCTLKGTLNVIPNLPKLKRSDVELNLLEVIPAEELKGVTTVEIAQRVYRLMADDLGPELVAEE